MYLGNNKSTMNTKAQENTQATMNRVRTKEDTTVVLYRPVGCKFLDQCQKEVFWLTLEGAKTDFPDCEVKGYTNTEILVYVSIHNIEWKDFRVYGLYEDQ